MHAIPRRSARAAVRSLTLPAAVALLLGAAASPAAAHTELVSTTPGSDAVLERMPSRVTLTFSDEMAEKYAKVAVTAADGTSAAAAGPAVAGKTVSLALRSGAGRPLHDRLSRRLRGRPPRLGLLHLHRHASIQLQPRSHAPGERSRLVSLLRAPS